MSHFGVPFDGAPVYSHVLDFSDYLLFSNLEKSMKGRKNFLPTKTSKLQKARNKKKLFFDVQILLYSVLLNKEHKMLKRIMGSKKIGRGVYEPQDKEANGWKRPNT